MGISTNIICAYKYYSNSKHNPIINLKYTICYNSAMVIVSIKEKELKKEKKSIWNLCCRLYKLLLSKVLVSSVSRFLEDG